MNKEVISDTHGICLMTMFIVGTSSMQVSGLASEQDLWLSIIMSILMAVPLMFVYSRLYELFPGKNILDIAEICFGKFIGKILIALFAFYMIEETFEVLRNTGQFIYTVGLIETPLITPTIFITLLCIFATKEGIEVISRFSKLFLPILIGFILFFSVSSIPNMDLSNIYPILGSGLKPVAKGTFQTFLFPFAQTVGFTIVFSSLKKNKSSYNIYFTSLFLGGLLIFILSLTSLLVLGINSTTSVYHPTYLAAARINIGPYMRGIEILISTILILAAFIKISILLLAACISTTHLFNLKDYRFIVTPIALLSLNISYFMVDNIKEYWEWSEKAWYHFSFPFQVILPIFIWFFAEIKSKKS
ncbi:GerAB/ArcD/ProY family transporter [Tepidibacter aestuarii]|uniref:GerAB/ArcD/ProY family transporter n=1 Tax=Tepidibacter aestuarii TaxID=2925782 RepID=UPI0020BE850F|nr:endospore germination permease [Tepidibacter aestuarii]CAH2214987.1 spore germination protein KB [Tepidibacter aestuarii]